MHAFSIRPPWPGAIRLATSNRISVRGYPLFQRTIFSPCGHAAHVDSVDFFASLTLATELHPAHNRLDNASRSPHDHKAGDDYFSLKIPNFTTIGCV
jgi:hypothetical protein